jgi:hypothetical protein
MKTITLEQLSTVTGGRSIAAQIILKTPGSEGAVRQSLPHNVAGQIILKTPGSEGARHRRRPVPRDLAGFATEMYWSTPR